MKPTDNAPQRPGTLHLLGKRPLASAPPKPTKLTKPKSDPFNQKPEPPTRPNSPAHRAQRLLTAWAKLTPGRMRLVEEIVAELQTNEETL